MENSRKTSKTAAGCFTGDGAPNAAFSPSLGPGCKWVGGISDRKEIPEKGEEGTILGRGGERQVAQPAGTSGESDSPRPTNSPMNH